VNHFSVSNSYGRPTAAFDLDGCLAEWTGTQELGSPVPAMVDLARDLLRDGWVVVVHSARPASHNPTVRAWLPADLAAAVDVACGAKPAADVFVDDRGLMLPPIALRERIELAVSDPYQMWAEGPIGTRPFTREWLEVHDNPEWHGSTDDEQFMVAVPCSSGLDSTTVLGMAVEGGLPAAPVYVVGDAPYTDHELERCQSIAHLVGAPQVTPLVTPPLHWQRLNGYIDLGRNPIYLWTIAWWMTGSGRWGEVWFGNVGEWGESPVTGGDKSHRFFVTYQQILTSMGLDVRIANPIAGLRKPDLVRWWLARGRPDVPLATFSCFDTGPDHCGRCRACFRRWLALSLGGLRNEATAQYPNGFDEFEPHAKAFMDDLAAPNRPATMAPGRVVGIAALLRYTGLVQ
jgi:7-cyano-7-deazaguanine synthase in queuosine biosynthesis